MFRIHQYAMTKNCEIEIEIGDMYAYRNYLSAGAITNKYYPKNDNHYFYRDDDPVRFNARKLVT